MQKLKDSKIFKNLKYIKNISKLFYNFAMFFTNVSNCQQKV